MSYMCGTTAIFLSLSQARRIDYYGITLTKTEQKKNS